MDFGFKDIIYAIGGMVAIVGSHFNNRNKIELVSNDLDNHKQNHEKLERRVTDHERRIDEKLDKIMDAVSDLKQDIAQLQK